jgi:protein-tyrosine-phosphatase
MAIVVGMPSQASKVCLIGFADALSAPEATWSLCEAGYTVVAVSRGEGDIALRASRLVTIVEIADPRTSIQAALAELEQLVKSLGNPILLPLDDESVWLFDEFCRRADATNAGPSGSQARIALDKRLQITEAAAAGFAVPPTINIMCAADFDKLDTFPVFVKPALATRTNNGRLGRGPAYFCQNRVELEDLSEKIDLSEPYIAQTFVRGVGEGVFGLAINGRILISSGHRRIRMMNPAGSGSSACAGISPDTDVMQNTIDFIRQIGWSGNFMVELLHSIEDGKHWFVELNGRSWGSMALARRSGYEYPAWTVKLATDAEFRPPEVVPPVNLMCRHVGREINHALFVLLGSKNSNMPGWPTRRHTLVDLLRLRRRDRLYNWNPSDPLVLAFDTADVVLGKFYRKAVSKLKSIVERIRSRLAYPAHYLDQRALRKAGALRDKIRRAESLLFVCYGNINRSALAECALLNAGSSSLRINSCGFHKKDRRPADPVMVGVAKAMAIELGDWSSRAISAGAVRSADLIFVMEVKHLVWLFRAYPEARGRTFLLGCAKDDPDLPLEIADPHGKAPAIYKACAENIVLAVTQIKECRS